MGKTLQKELWDALSECEFAIGELEIVPLVEGWGEPRHDYKLGVSLPSNAGTVYRLYDAYQAANSIINDQDTLGQIEMSGDGSLGDIAWRASGVSASLSGHVTEAGWQSAAQAVRSKVIEEAIETLREASQTLREDVEYDIGDYVYWSTRRIHWGEAIQALETLKSNDREAE